MFCFLFSFFISDFNMAELPKWREKIVDALRERDMRQVECFRGLINDYNRLFEGADSLRQNINRTLFQERAVGGHQISGDAGPALAAATEKIQLLSLETLSERSDAALCKLAADILANPAHPLYPGEQLANVLEQKQVHMLEELTSLHRRRGENAQMIVDLNSDLAKLRQQLAATDQLLAESTADCETLKERIASLEQTNSELNATNQTLKDEYNALHLIYMQMEKNFKEAQTERDSLLARCLEIKSNVAEKMNQENEEFVRRRQLRVQRELEDATRDVVVVPPDTSRVAACIEAALPTKSITSFVSDRLYPTGSYALPAVNSICSGIQQSRKYRMAVSHCSALCRIFTVVSDVTRDLLRSIGGGGETHTWLILRISSGLRPVRLSAEMVQSPSGPPLGVMTAA
ncbi:Autophagy-related protein 16 [Amphibalanus amphitrite]|uniref:Autophagy-related protein 16 n=1 Tax=Amphibalanus amphitrite TaxID=1232801 RepID=A0A6A4WH19_AMPAM|nr:Autophagy-related protein 16 [Amphibalanus amphitrite]